MGWRSRACRKDAKATLLVSREYTDWLMSLVASPPADLKGDLARMAREMDGHPSKWPSDYGQSPVTKPHSPPCWACGMPSTKYCWEVTGDHSCSKPQCDEHGHYTQHTPKDLAQRNSGGR